MANNIPSTEVKEAPAIQDQGKKEIQPKRGSLDFQEQIFELIPLAGTMDVNEEQKKILFAPVNEEDVEIRADGLVYLPWMEYVSRLRDAFALGWAIIPQGGAKLQDNKVMWAFWLIINGKPAGFAVGEQEYQPTNARMTYGDALEGAKSNALMRLCKGIGISLELWRPSFVRAWKEKFAEQYKDEKKGMLWRKKSSSSPTSNVPSETTGITEPQMKLVNTLLSNQGFKDDYARHNKVAEILKLNEVPMTLKGLSKSDASTIIEALQKEKK